MSDERIQLALSVFRDVCELPPDERAAVLETSCRGDRELLAEVESMLACDASDDGLQMFDPWAIPETIGGYRIVRVIAHGGMGTVFEAEQDNPRRRVALKVLKLGFALPKLLERFELEKEVLARLQHPGIAQIFEAGTAEVFGTTQPWFAMELVDGLSLTEYAGANELSIRGRLELFVRVCDAVHHAHQKGVIHRDLKPANILVTAEGQPKVLDFGIARAADSDIQLTTFGTSAAQIVGTLPYMSPEQASATPEELDVRSDVYGLGVVLYELLTGGLPYDVGNTALPSAIRIICEQAPRRISTMHRALRGDLETIVGKALEKDKERRYASADALAADVRRYLRDEPIEARPASRLYKLAKFTRRNKLLVTTASALLIALLAGFWFATRFALEEGRQRRASERREYAAKINAALAEIGAYHVTAASRLLEGTDPEFRDWEWRYLHARLDQGVQQITGLQEPPWYAAFLHGSNRVLALDEAGAAHLWDTRTEHPAAVEFSAQPGEVPESRHVIAVSADGALVLTFALIRQPEGGERTVAFLYQAESGDVVQRFPVDGLLRLNSGSSAIAPGGTHVALTAEGGLYLYETRTPRLLRRFESGQREWACTFSSRGEWFVYAKGPEVCFWDLAASREARAAIRGATQAGQVVSELALSPDRSLLVTSVGATIHTWDVATGSRLHTISSGGATVYNLVFGGGGSFLLSIANGATRLWNPTTGALLRTFPAYTQYGCLPGFDSTGRRLVTGHSSLHDPRDRRRGEYGIRIWNLAVDEGLVLRGHETFVYPVAISPNERVIASGSFDGKVCLWDADTSQKLATLRGDDRADRMPVHALTFDPRSDRLVVATRSGGGQVGVVQVWSTATGKLDRRFERHRSTSVAFSPDGALLLVGNGHHERNLTVLDGRSPDEDHALRVLEAYSGMITFSKVGDLFATADSSHKTIVVWDTATLETSFVLESPFRVTSIAFSPDGSRLAVGGDRGGLALWDLTGRRCLGSVQAQSGEVFAVVFLSPRRLASGGRDGVLHIWDASTDQLELLVELRGHADYIYSLALSSDGQRLVSGSGDATVRIWETHPISRRLRAQRGR